MKAIYKKELNAYFCSPIGYVFIGAYLIVSGLVFSINVIGNQRTDMASYFSNMMMFVLMLIPVLTMKLFSEEKKQKTDQLLLTAPVKITEIVLGKYFAALTVFAAAMAVTLLYPLILSFFGAVPVAKILGSYIGMFFLSTAFIAIGMCISALSESQVIAAVATFAVLLLVWIMDTFAKAVNVPVITGILSFLSLLNRFTDFYLGTLNLGSVIYFCTFSGFFVFLTVMIIERRRWV